MRSVRSVLFGSALGICLAIACDKQDTKSPDDEGKSGNLCRDYNTCDECIAGQQGKGVTKGEAETQCGAAVLGCWTTWEKPIVCSGQVQKKEAEPDEPDEP